MQSIIKRIKFFFFGRYFYITYSFITHTEPPVSGAGDLILNHLGYISKEKIISLAYQSWIERGYKLHHVHSIHITEMEKKDFVIFLGHKIRYDNVYEENRIETNPERVN